MVFNGFMYYYCYASTSSVLSIGSVGGVVPSCKFVIRLKMGFVYESHWNSVFVQ